MYSRSPVVLFICIIFIISSCLIAQHVEAQDIVRSPNPNDIKIVFTPMISNTDKDLRSISGNSPKNVFAVGAEGTIIHYDGEKWSSHPKALTKENLNAVWVSPKDDIYAVGDKGTIIHSGFKYKAYPIKQWSLLTEPPTDENLNNVWGSSANDIYAIGDNGTIINSTDKQYKKYEAQQWSMLPKPPTKENLNAIWGSSINDIFAVGNRGTVIHFNGTQWSQVQKPPTKENLNAVWGSHEKAGITIFAVGNGGTILRFDGKEWSHIKNPAEQNNLNGIWGSSINNIFIVGNKGTVVHFNGEEWSQIQMPTKANLNAVWGSLNPHVFVVGQDGFAGVCQSGFGIKGKILNPCSSGGPTPINGAKVEALVGGSWIEKATAPYGEYGVDPQTIFSSANNTLRFSAGSSYKMEGPLEVTLLEHKVIETNTYLLPNQTLDCISGVISKEVVQDNVTFCQSISSPTNISIKLFRLVNCVWTQIGTAINPNGEGHYCFPDLDDGTYKVVPQRSGYTYTPEYDNINIVIPQPSPQAYDFKEEQ